MTVSSTNNKASYSANGSTTTFAYNFKITAESELKVFIRSAAGTETLKTLTTHYTITNVGVAGGGNVVFVTSPSDHTPANGETVVIQRVVPLTQATDYVENDPFPAATHEAALDKLTFVAQQLQEEIDRTIKLSVTNTMTSTEFTTSATDRASKVLAFDSSGELSVTTELGTYKGNWAASTDYVIRDLVKDTSTGNIFFVNTAHTSSGSQPLTSNANSAKYSLLVDAASATTSANAAATSAQLADDYAVKVSGAVTGTDYSSKAWAVGGTGVTTTSSRGAAKEWATTTGGQVDTSEYSSKEYAIGTTATSSKSYALKTDGAVTGSDYSSKAWATGGTGVTTSSGGGAAKEWATTTGGAVDTSEFSAKEYSTGTTVGTGSSKQWALGGGSFVQGTAVAGGEYSAKYHAAAASTSASAAATSASNASTSAGTASTKAGEAASSATAAASSQVAAAASAAAAATSYDSFDDRYLGTKSSDPTVDNDGNALVAGALYFSTSSNTMMVYDGSSWIAATSAGTTSLLIFKYVATNGQTTFSGSDANSATLTYTVNNIIVTVNGVVLDSSDITATNGTSIVLTACDTGDEVVIYSFKSFEVSGALSLSNGGTVAGNTTFTGSLTGTLTGNADTATTATNANHVNVADNESTNENNLIPFIEDASATGNVGLESDGDFHYNPSTGRITATQLAGTLQTAAQPNVTSTGTLTALNVSGDVSLDGGNFVFNESGADKNFRIEGDTEPNLFVCDAGDDSILITGQGNTGGNGALYIHDKRASGDRVTDLATSATHSGFRFQGHETDSTTFSIGYSADVAGAYTIQNSNGTTGYYLEIQPYASGIGINTGGSATPTAHNGFQFESGILYACGNSSSANYKVRFYDNTGMVGSILVNAGGTAFNTSSDYRLKENDKAMTGSIKKVKQLKPITFNFKSTPNVKQEGFFAHEIAEVVPQAVIGEKDAMEKDLDGETDIILPQQVDLGKVVPLLTSALKEAIAKIETLETKVKNLEKKL